MRILIDRRLLGTDRHMLVDGSARAWEALVPADAWHLSGQLKPPSQRCMDTLLRLEHLELNIEPSKKHVDAFRSVVPENAWPPPWQKCMSARDFESFSESLFSKAMDALTLCDETYYVSTYVAQTSVFDALQRARISRAAWNEAMLDDSVRSTVRKFEPGSNGLALPVVYDRFGTKTGRLTCVGGPSMLTLRKDLRGKLLLPSEPDEELWMLDYSALEPRVLLYEAGFRCDDVDLYDAIRRKQLPDVPRDVVKGAIIAAAYGMSKHAWGKRLGVEGTELDTIDGAVRSKFGAHELLARLRRQVIERGFIRNRFGRKIVLDDLHDHRLLNAYAQSTGADVALLGFDEMLQKHAVKPLFLLHDAVIVSAPHGTFIENQILRVKCDGYVQSFLLKCVHI